MERQILTDCKVLIVDDHSLFREGLYRILKDAGIQTIREACNGEEACIMAKKFLPDIILMDLYMPGLNGIETTQQILASTPQATVVILTVNEGDDTIAEALRAGAQGFLNKNMRSKEIINALNQLLLGKIPLAKSSIEIFSIILPLQPARKIIELMVKNTPPEIQRLPPEKEKC